MISLGFSDGTAQSYQVARTLRAREELDRRLYRSPFGTTWRVEGSGEALPSRVGVEVETWEGASGDSVEALTYGGEPLTYGGEPLTYTFSDVLQSDPAAVIADAEAAVSLATPYWSADLAGLVQAVTRPVRNRGYRVRLEWLTREPRS